MINIDVDNPWFSSESGVLYSKDFDNLLHYPKGTKLEVFAVHENMSKPLKIKNEYLQQIILNDKLTSIERIECRVLTHIDFGKSQIGTFPKNAFVDCAELQRIALPSTLEKIEDSAFDNCAKLAAFDTINNERFAFVDNGLHSMDRREYIYYAGGDIHLQEYIIDSTVEIVYAGAFQHCDIFACNACRNAR